LDSRGACRTNNTTARPSDGQSFFVIVVQARASRELSLDCSVAGCDHNSQRRRRLLSDCEIQFTCSVPANLPGAMAMASWLPAADSGLRNRGSDLDAYFCVRSPYRSVPTCVDCSSLDR